MTTHKRYIGNIISHAGSNAVGMAMQMGLLLVLSWQAEVATFGVYLSAVALIGVTEMASDFGTRVLAVRQFARPHDETGFAGVLGSKLVYGVAMFLIVPWLPIPMLTDGQVLLCLLIALSQPSTDPMLWFLEGRNRFDVQAGVFLAWRTATVLLIGMVGILDADVTTMLWMWLLCNVFRWLMEQRIPLLKGFMQDFGRIDRGSLRQGLQLAKKAFPIGIAFFLVSLFQRLGVFLLGSQGDPWQVALYGVAFTIVASSGFVGTSITLASFPRLSRSIDAQDWESAARIVRQKIGMISLIFVPSCAMGMLLAPFLMPLLLGEKYVGGSSVMVLLLAGLYISVINFSLKYVLNALHRNWMDAASALLGIVIYCAWVLWPTGAVNAERAAIAWGVSETGAFVLKCAVVYMDGRLTGVRLPLVLALSLLLAWMAMVLAG